MTDAGSLIISDSHTVRRKKRSAAVQTVVLSATLVSVLVLCVLLITVVNNAFGPVAVEDEIAPESLAIDGLTIAEMARDQLVGILEARLSKGLLRRLNHEKSLIARSEADLLAIIEERIVNPTVVESWSMADAVFRSDVVERFFHERPQARREFRAWIHPKFLINSQSSAPEDSGVRTAILGSVWIVLFGFIFAFPIGIGAAVYLEEYVGKGFFQRAVQINIHNLAGIPSIIYGLLGLTVFVRFLVPVTSGAVFGAAGPSADNGRTVLSAGLTLGLLILPIIIINAQEALRGQPDSLRLSSYALGASRWQTIRWHLLPNSLERIMTGTIIALSRAVGETAPLVVVGASTFVSLDPTGPFSKFTALPIQIYQWSARPQGEFRNIAAAAIIVLLVLLLGMNSFAIAFRNRCAKGRFH